MNKVLIKRFQGFTLIELLVVMAIITTLTSVILLSLNGSRLRASDAAIKGNLISTRAQGLIFYDMNNRSYCPGTCVCDTGAVEGIRPLIINAAKQLNASPNILGNAQAFVYNSNGTANGSSVCHNDIAGTGWAAIVSLKKPTTANAGWCVDSAGASQEATVLTASSIVCGQ